MIEIENLAVCIQTGGGERPVLRRIDLSLGAGEILGLVGRSGAGKTVLANTLTGLIAPPFHILSGRIRINGKEILPGDRRAWRKARGRDVFMIFQSSAMALNPTMTIADQVAEAVTGDKRGKIADRVALDLLSRVGIASPQGRYYPHQISGGMRQRVQVAVALALSPKVLIADEPTTGLDPVTQDQILKLLEDLVADHGMSMIFISHDLRVVARLTQRVETLQDGRLLAAGGAGGSAARCG